MSNSVASIWPVSSTDTWRHPVEVFVARQVVENLAGAFADQRLEIHQVARREHRRHDLALVLVLRRIFLNEHRQVELRIRVCAAAEADAADRESDEKIWWCVSQYMMSSNFVSDQYGPN